MARTMRCPWCGSPATVRGNQWECGYCGDSGFLQTAAPSPVTITLTVTGVEGLPDETDCEEAERHAVMEPDLESSRAAVKDWDFSVHEQADRDLLVVSYPQLTEEWSYEQLKDAYVFDILQKTYEDNPKTAIGMWQLLLDTAEEHLHEEEAASFLVGEYAEWIRAVGDFEPLLDALERDCHFASQVFQSAHMGRDHLELLTQCVEDGRDELYESLRALLDESPFPEERREFSDQEIDEAVEEVRRRKHSVPRVTSKKATAAQPIKAAATDDGRTYRYCQVRFDGVSRAYSYLTEDTTIQPGDYVLAPLGQDDHERSGKVEQVDIYTAANAPYPPERTKYISGKTDAPPELETVEEAIVIPSAEPIQEADAIEPPQVKRVLDTNANAPDEVPTTPVENPRGLTPFAKRTIMILVVLAGICLCAIYGIYIK